MIYHLSKPKSLFDRWSMKFGRSKNKIFLLLWVQLIKGCKAEYRTIFFCTVGSVIYNKQFILVKRQAEIHPTFEKFWLLMYRGFYENPRALLKKSCTKQSPITRKQYDCVIHFTSSLTKSLKKQHQSERNETYMFLLAGASL